MTSESASGITVIAERGAELHDWMVSQREMAANPQFSQSGDRAVIGLGFEDIGDQLFKSVGVGFDVNTGSFAYEISATLTPTSSDPNIVVSEHKSDQLGAFSGMAFSLDQARSLTPPLDLARLAVDLRRPLKKHGFLPSYHASESQNVIVMNKDGVAPGNAFSFHDQRVELPEFIKGMIVPIEGYCFHKRGFLDQSLVDFENNYQDFARLLTLVTAACYRQKVDIQPPVKNFRITLPEQAEKVMAFQRRKIEAAKRMMTAGGFDNDDNIRRDIREKISLSGKPKVRFDDVVGCIEAKEQLAIVVDALRHPEVYQSWGACPPRGVLLHGDPGTGKTFLAQAVAGEASATFLKVNRVDIMHGLYGRSERYIKAVFEEAAAHAPAIIFFDEIDSLAVQRGAASEVNSSLVSTILTCMQGVEDLARNIVIIAATNRKEAIDEAILRSGRFSIHAKVERPTTEDRLTMIRKRMATNGRETGRNRFANDLDMGVIGSSTTSFTGADIEEIMRSALAKKARQQSQTGIEPGPVTTEDLVIACRAIGTRRSDWAFHLKP